MPRALWLAGKGEAAKLREITEGDLNTAHNGRTPKTAVTDSHTGTSVEVGETAETRVRIRVEYSDINYKDALAVIGAPGVVREFPLVPGIDVVGIVEGDPTGTFPVGTRVVGIGGGLGETMHGGFSEIALVEAQLLIEVPEGLDNFTAAAIGTAGFTAALCVNRLLVHGIEPESEVWVTGSTGGVGSVAVLLLAGLGYKPVAVTSKASSEESYLLDLGASRIVDAAELKEAGKPLQGASISSAIDTLGSVPLANILARVEPGGVVASCGLAAGGDLPTSVMPFILRSVTLAGVNSVHPLPGWREAAWELLEQVLDVDALKSITRTVELGEVTDAAKALLDGTNTGRIVVKL